MSNSKTIAIRLSLKDGDVTKRALMQLGAEGQGALQKLERAALPASRGLKALNVVSNEARGGMEMFGSRLGAAGSGLMALGPAGLIAAAGIGATTLAFGALMRSARGAIDEVAKIKDEAETAGMTAEAYQELAFVMDKANVSQEAYTDGMKELTLRADEFVQTGKGSGADAFMRLGFSQSQLKEGLKDTSKLFEDVIKRMEGLDKAAQIRISDEIFGGTGGEQFVRVIELGSEKVSEFKRQARDLGLVLGNEVVENADKTRDELNQMQKVIDTQLNAALIELGPLLLDISKFMTKIATATADVVNAFKDLENQSSGSLSGRLEELNAFFDKNPNAPSGGHRKAAWQEKSKERQQIIDQLEARKKAADDAAKRAAAKSGGHGGIDVEAEKQRLKDEEEQKKLEKKRTDSKADIDLKNLQMKQLADAYSRSSVEVKNLQNAFELENEASKLGIDFTSAQGQAWREAFMEGQVLEDVLNGLEEAQRRNAEIAGEFGGAFSRAFEDVILNAKDAKEAVRGLLDEMVKIAMRAVVMKPLENAVTSLVSNVDFAGMFGINHTGGIAGMETSYKQASPAVFHGAPKYHGGGLAGLKPNEVPSILLRGEEVLTTSDPRHRFNGGGAGNPVSVVMQQTNHIDAKGADVSVLPRIQSLLEKTKREAVSEALAGVQHMADKGGKYAKSLGRR